ncbi:23S rRNA (pseudouridine(1915)-N(3))-methyltransferase RlmH [Oceanotoga sp. DSM 15011]|jgi:23S rRNA (pseudouridine1915-N3)-methyltransferase|uniref:Ribosomal RNA large subunit methyltransferase H n=1 Tax=Oceanotoga teriensis TaxID=515440 RepID=A0AA45C5I7_9BACT|nr:MULTISPECIES: 23S rRNA (pseudouridine(1915)-N(3))-methyltransferase RlmH [Oceanotoga]MDN5342315.1 rRNA (pseudouridine1915-N3)-methyltransferase [Oceanotoga sp.]MDO7977378.1 23S rRNA (pseudouridine(1915)-N(3))-methyltransferase RlmH [Oceanotoga teriensis]PWJ88768.1 23S rRNA (pseudouridine1915-N3)-methyltransferase [Oceanotoga teriensis]UYP00405.1 23S rRNA (pseudouridine(1915)-N(3))-methyltransferase RlmH [Oceanotoga sp. DSM 15011]
MKYRIILIGPIKTSYIKKGISQYLKWISKFQKIEFIEIPLSGDLNKISPEQYKLNDYNKIEKYMENSINIVLDERGENFNSIEFAKKLDKFQCYGKKYITFFIGGPLGHHQKIYQSADLIMGLSKMTFTHEMVSLFIAEQIFRSFKINNNEKYHY